MGRKILFGILTLMFICSFFSVASTVEAEAPEDNSSTVGMMSMDWSGFWQLFRAYSVWDLEWHNGASWISKKSDLTIIRDYPEPNHCKITLVFDASETGNYRLTFAIDVRVRSYVQKLSQYQYNLTYEGYSIIFDWSDVLSIPNLQISHGVLNGYFWFRLRRDNIPQGAHVEIDPSLVGISSDISATRYAFQRKCFYANGRFWLFYHDGSGMVCRSSTDGSSWSGGTVRDVNSGREFSVWFDDTYVHYAYSRSLTTSAMYYRRGTPLSNGSITWSASEQTVLSADSELIRYYPQITADSNGYPFIGYRRHNDTEISSYPYAIKSNTTDGTWSTDSGFPYQLNSTNLASWTVNVVPLTTSKAYAIYVADDKSPNGQLWNGTAWGSEENLPFTISSHGYSVVNEDDDIHFVAQAFPSSTIQYMKRIYGTGWGSQETLVTGTYAHPVLAVMTNELFCFWGNETDDHIYYKKRNALGAWDTTATDWIDESTDEITDDNTLTCFYQIYGGYIGLAYLTSTASPYNVTFAYLDIGEYYYTLMGPYDEDTAYLTNNPISVTAYFTTTYQDDFILNGTMTVFYTEKPLYFRFGFSNPRQYWLSDTESSATIYVFNASTTVYTISFLDLAGALDDYPLVEARRYINGTSHIIEKRKVDEEKKISMSLINGEKYTLTVKDGSTYTFGDVLMSSTTAIQLTLKGIDFPKETLLTYKYVRVYGTRTLGASGIGNITIVYEDTLSLTNSVTIYINYRNGTNVYNATETAQSFSHLWAYALNSTDYRVTLTINHQRYGTYGWRQYFSRGFSESPWGLGFLGSLPFATNVIIPSFLIIFVAGCFSQVNAEVGAFMAVVVAAGLTLIGWIPISPGYLITAFCIAVLMALIVAKRRVQF